MKRIKVIILFVLLLFITYLYLDNKSYYYGFGKGFLSSKLPNYIRPYYRGTDTGNTGFAFVERDIELDIIDNLHPVYLSNNNKIMIKKFLGYNFDQKTVTIKVRDISNKTRYIEIQENSDKNNEDFVFKELSFTKSDIKYIDLDYNLSYFKRIKLIKNISLILSVLSLIYLFRVLYKNKK